MAIYLAVIEAPSVREHGDQYPKYVTVKGSNQEQAKDHIRKNLLPKHQGSTITLYGSLAEFIPATHVEKVVTSYDIESGFRGDGGL